MIDPLVIVAAKRTPIGALLGQFKTLSAPDLGAIAIQAALESANLPPHLMDEIIMGCVLSAGIGQAPARQAALKAGLPNTIPATTINKMCGSGMKALFLASQQILAHEAEIMVAGGMESMTQAPFLLKKGREGYRLGHEKIYDHLFLDGLEDAYEKKLMGVYAEETAKTSGFTREAQDAFAIESLERAQKAQREGYFKNEIAKVTLFERQESRLIQGDEGPLTAKRDKIPLLKPAFDPNGTITAANASSISDGASALILMRESKAIDLGIQPLARILGMVSYATAPHQFTIAPIEAIKRLQTKIKLDTKEIDLYEINEAFAVVTMAAIAALKLDHQRVNIHGGACALGHPIGASGARITCTLLHALQTHQLKRGIASLCIGGGEATALAIELMT